MWRATRLDSLLLLVLVVALPGAGCAPGDVEVSGAQRPDDAGRDGGAVARDTGEGADGSGGEVAPDAGPLLDTGLSPDAGGGDAGAVADAGGADAGDADAGGAGGDAGTTPGSIYAPLAPEPSSYDGPLRITSGGTYSGAWRSDDPDVAAVVIATDEPVIIEDCFVRTAGWGFREGAPGIDVTIRDCQIRPTAAGLGEAHAVGFASASNVLLENNYLEDIDGFEIYQWWVQSTPTQTLRILRNRARNIRSHMGNFVSMNTVNGLDDAEIAWNEVINEPGASSVEDNINAYNSSGIASSPLAIHDNFVWGAYPYPDPTAGGFTGTGMTTDGDSRDEATITAHVHAYENHFVGTCNAAMNVAAGHDVVYERNRMITSGMLADGRRLTATFAATAIFDFYDVGPSLFYDNRVDDNVIGFVSFGYNNPFPDRNDGSWEGCDDCANTSLPNPITYQTEVDEHERWKAKVAAAGLQIGPR